jgi:hypothetical protein
MERQLTSQQPGQITQDRRHIELPAPTAWPFVLAFGVTLLFAGLVTSASVSLLGAVVALAGSVGWFREVLPHEHEVEVPVISEEIVIATDRRVVERVPILHEQVRAWLPIETYPVSAGVKGGLAGSVAMAVVACTFGLLRFGSIWYPINLLAAVVDLQSLKAPGGLNAFHFDSFGFALAIHVVVSITVGLLYGAMLPMFPRRPILLGGLIAPVLWSALVYTMLGLVNPMMATHIDWSWFVASQVAFGVVAGLVVVRQSRMLTAENVPFAMRAGIEAPGIMSEREGGKKP